MPTQYFKFLGDKRIKIIQKLFDATNTLNVTLHSRSTQSTETSTDSVQWLQRQLDRSFQWFYNQATLQHEFVSSNAWEKDLTLKLEEAEIATTSSSGPSRTYDIVCPRASLPAIHDPGLDSLELRFVCHCQSADHNHLMLYQGFGARSIPVEVIGPSLASTWEMFCRKADAIISVRLSNFLPTHSYQLEALSCYWSKILHRSAVPDRDNEMLMASEKSISMLRTKTTAALSSLKVLTITFFTTDTRSGRNFFKVPWKLKYLQLFHYSTTETKLLTASREVFDDTLFLDESHFFVFLSEQHPMSKGVDMSTMDLFKVKVSHSTILKDLSESRKVIIVDTDCAGGGKSPRVVSCSEVHFEFCDTEDARHFLWSIKIMQNRLFEKSLQRPLLGEDVVFRQVFASSEMGSDIATLTHVAIVYSPLRPQANYRLIAISDDNAGSMCYELESLSLLEDHSTWLSETPPSEFVWFTRNEQSGRMTIHKHRWDELQNHTRIRDRVHNLDSGPALTRGHELSSDKWFNEIEDINVVLRASRIPTKMESNYRPVKIAIIDTGFDKNAKDITRRRVVKYKDFVTAERAPDARGIKDKAGVGETGDPLSSMQDLAGHGTTSVNLILKGYKDADLYVARVFESDTVTGELEQYLMADAITWATKHQVDIISISAGFQEGLRELYQAVSEASRSGILIFASAANWSYADRAAVPARLPHVFCVFSTDAGFKNSRAYNPPALENDHNFAILGEDVQVSPEEQSVSGTSVSAAIMAGFAARIIDFSRQSDCRAAIEALVSPETEFGMAAILKALANKDGGYECIRPLRILGRRSRAEHVVDREGDRKHVIGFLCRILRDAL